jgi:hypothetical protein
MFSTGYASFGHHRQLDKYCGLWQELLCHDSAISQHQDLYYSSTIWDSNPCCFLSDASFVEHGTFGIWFWQRLFPQIFDFFRVSACF